MNNFRMPRALAGHPRGCSEPFPQTETYWIPRLRTTLWVSGDKYFSSPKGVLVLDFHIHPAHLKTYISGCRHGFSPGWPSQARR